MQNKMRGYSTNCQNCQNYQKCLICCTIKHNCTTKYCSVFQRCSLGQCGTCDNSSCGDKSVWCRRTFHKRIVHKRVSAPSRIRFKKIDRMFCKKREIKSKMKSFIQHDVPDSSAMKKCAYASFRVNVINRLECVCFSYYKYKFRKMNLCRGHSVYEYCGCERDICVGFRICRHDMCRLICQKIFCIVDLMLLLCGDIEENPSPVVDGWM